MRRYLRRYTSHRHAAALYFSAHMWCAYKPKRHSPSAIDIDGFWSSTALGNTPWMLSMTSGAMPPETMTPFRRFAALPSNVWALFQVVEYLRAFLFGRLGWSRLNGMLIISGAFGLFKTEVVSAVGVEVVVG